MSANIAGFLRESAQRHPDGPCLIAGAETRTWADVDRAADAVAAGLLTRGLHAGDRVALLLGNSIDFVVGYYGALRAGLTVVPLNPAYTSAEVAVLRAWAEQGAAWADGFAFKKPAYEPPLRPRRPVLPEAKAGRTHPVDRVLDGWLAAKGASAPVPAGTPGWLLFESTTLCGEPCRLAEHGEADRNACPRCHGNRLRDGPQGLPSCHRARHPGVLLRGG